jgi:hypothetical protein
MCAQNAVFKGMEASCAPPLAAGALMPSGKVDDPTSTRWPFSRSHKPVTYDLLVCSTSRTLCSATAAVARCITGCRRPRRKREDARAADPAAKPLAICRRTCLLYLEAVSLHLPSACAQSQLSVQQARETCALEAVVMGLGVRSSKSFCSSCCPNVRHSLTRSPQRAVCCVQI